MTGAEAEDTTQEDFQYKLKVYIDCTVDKRFVVNLSVLIKHSSYCFTGHVKCLGFDHIFTLSFSHAVLKPGKVPLMD